MTGRVTLRPVREDDLPLLRKLAQDPQLAGEFELYGWYAPMLFQRGWEKNRLIGPGGGTLAMVCGDDLAGAMASGTRCSTPSSGPIRPRERGWAGG